MGLGFRGELRETGTAEEEFSGRWEFVVLLNEV